MSIISRQQAVENGAIKYKTGKVCAKGHYAERYVSGNACVKCATDKMAKKRSDKCPKLAAAKAKHYRKEKEKYKAYSVLYVAKSKEEKTEYDAKRYEENREAVGLKVVKWRIENPVMLKAQRTNRKARVRGAAGSHTHEDILRMIILQKHKCPYCLCSIKEEHHVDHIIPVSKGGSNNPENIQILCPTCNMKKSNKMPEQWANQLGRLI